jgi:predicted dehydrogenase/threonine dehydrogenase-like Zn-dependent dehydrogenase
VVKQVVAIAGKVQISEVPKPVCDDDGILVRTSFSVISTGTETWTIDSTEPLSPTDLVKNSKISKAVDLSRKVLSEEGVNGFMDYFDSVRHPQFAIGYSSSGVVIQVGRRVRDVSVGERVACAGEGKACHAEIVSVPRNLAAKIPDGVDARTAAFTTIGAIALHAFRQSRAQIGEYVAVIGVGLVGNLVSQIARASGCMVAALDLRDDRLELAKSLGADHACRSDDPLLIQHLSHFTNGRLFDAVILCAATSSSEPVNMAAKILRSRGRLVIVGRVGMDLERKEFYQKELEFVMSRSLGPGRYDPVYEEKGVDYPLEYVRWTLNRNMDGFLGLLKAGRINVESLIGAEFPLASAQEAYSFLDAQDKVAIILNYPATETATTIPPTAPPALEVGNEKKETPERINAALVGPGNFAKETLIPTLRRNENYVLKWVVSSNPVNATKIAKRYRFEKHTCDYQEVLKDPDTHLIVISAPNNLHYPMVLDAIRARKSVFVEKPLCLTRDELDSIKKAREESARDKAGAVPVFVGFNRRYAPQVLKIREIIRKLDGPFMISFRANVGFTAASRWVQDPDIGGGRIIAECCHFFDLFNFLLGQSALKEIQVASVDVNGSSTVARDNVSVTLKYADGSVATLVYVSLGHKAMDRERLEVFGQGVSIVLEDFKNLTVFGTEQSGKPTLRMNLPRQDKGWEAEIEQLARFLRGKDSQMISFEECVEATELTLRVDEAVRVAKSSDDGAKSTEAAGKPSSHEEVKS